MAEKICDRLRPHVPNRCNPAQDTRNLAVLREINDNIPGVVIEFINQRDPLDAALVTATNKDKWATAVKDGVVDFYNATP